VAFQVSLALEEWRSKRGGGGMRSGAFFDPLGCVKFIWDGTNGQAALPQDGGKE
jgi:hypothetical protein